VRRPVDVALAFQIENTPVVLLYARGQIAEREVSPIFVATTHERVAILPVAVARLEFVVARLVVRVVMFVVFVAVWPERVAMLPVAVARLVFNAEMLPVAVERPIVRLFILTSCAVLLPWSFWRATRRESLAVTVPDPATNPVRREERDIFPEKAL
jgi:hypothetical protein